MCWRRQQVPHQRKFRGAFDLAFILTAWTDAQRDVGDVDRGGHHNKTGILITTNPGGHYKSSQRLLKTSIMSVGPLVTTTPSPLCSSRLAVIAPLLSMKPRPLTTKLSPLFVCHKALSHVVLFFCFHRYKKKNTR